MATEDREGVLRETPAVVDCPECGGNGWTAETTADPLPSGEPGEPYQVQRGCDACGGQGQIQVLLAQPGPRETGLLEAAAIAEAHSLTVGGYGVHCSCGYYFDGFGPDTRTQASCVRQYGWVDETMAEHFVRVVRAALTDTADTAETGGEDREGER